MRSVTGSVARSMTSHFNSAFRTPHSALRLVRYRHVRRLQPYRAALELRHFRVRIEHRIGEQVGGGLAEVERHEYLTARHALRNAGRAHHRVAARRQPYEVAVLEPELARIVGVDLDDGRGLTLVEARGASRHRAGMPVI